MINHFNINVLHSQLANSHLESFTQHQRFAAPAGTPQNHATRFFISNPLDQVTLVIVQDDMATFCDLRKILSKDEGGVDTRGSQEVVQL